MNAVEKTGIVVAAFAAVVAGVLSSVSFVWDWADREAEKRLDSEQRLYARARNGRDARDGTIAVDVFNPFQVPVQDAVLSIGVFDSSRQLVYVGTESDKEFRLGELWPLEISGFEVGLNLAQVDWVQRPSHHDYDIRMTVTAVRPGQSQEEVWRVSLSEASRDLIIDEAYDKFKSRQRRQ